MERGKIFAVLYGDRRDRLIDPMRDIPPLMDYLRQDAVARRGYIVEPSESRALARQ